MGNYVSQCVAVGAQVGAAAIVIGPDGCQRRLDELSRVAELMIDAPGHVVARAADVRRERRVRALRADEPLRAGEVYLLAPVGRAGARLSDWQVAVVSGLVSGKRGRRGGSHGRIFPEVASEEEEKGVKGKVTGWAGQHAQAHGHGPRPWRPVLDTIHES